MVFFELRDISRDRIDGVVLQHRVERRINLESLQMAVEARNLVYKTGHVIGEVRRAPKPERFGDFNRRRDCCGVGRIIDHSRALHHPEHDVAALETIIRMPPRMLKRRRLDHPNTGRGLGRRDLGKILVEEVTRCLRHPLARRAAILAYRNIVDIALEDFTFSEPDFDYRGDRQLAEFAAKSALAPLHKSSRQLLRNRARSLRHPTRTKVGDRGLDDTNRLYSRMVVEKAIFVREQSFDQVWLELPDLHLDPLRGRAGQEPPNNFRLEHRL